jgi:hypothetical protein
MKVERERETGGLVIKAETPEEDELLKYLWCNRGCMAEFTNKKDGCELVIAPTKEDECQN